MDIGGFAVESRYYNATGTTLAEWHELNARWFQFGAFCPLFRSHGQFPYREIYNIAPEGSEVYASLQYYDKLRYRLMPYLYSLAGHAYFHDYTLMRGLIMDFGADEKIKNIGDQFMLGPSLLVNPVSEFNARSREVYLPSTTGWYDFYSGKFFEGGSMVHTEAPLNRMPVFVKEGSIIPAGVEMQYTNEKPLDVITLYIYGGKDADFELYEDEGLNYNYEKGQYATTPLHYDEATHTLAIGDRAGSYNGMVQERKFEIVWITKENAVSFDKPIVKSTVGYHGKSISINMNK
jgi:alpha-D-xyloside xylohydrolase